jgi:hypothetical protein
MESKVITQETLFSVVTRMEALVNKLEGMQVGQSQQQINQVNISSTMLPTEKITAFSEYWNKTFHQFLELKKFAEETKKPEIESLTEIVIEAICFQQDILIASETFKKPQGKDLQDLAKKYSELVTRVEDMKKDKRDFALHCEAVRNGLDCICWMFNEISCDAICQTYFEAIDYPANKLFLQKVPEISAWVKALKVVFKAVSELVKANYKSGINWSPKGEDDINIVLLSIGNTFSKNFKKQEEAKDEKKVIKQEENQKPIKDLLTSGELRKNLKPAPNSNIIIPKAEPEKTEPSPKKEEVKNVAENNSKAEPEAPKSEFISTRKKEAKKGRRETIWKKGKNEQYEKIRGSFYFQNLEGEVREIDPEKLENKTILTFNNCYNSTFTVNKKINAIKLTNCEDVNIICDSLISIFEIVNCVGVKVQVNGIVKSFTIDGSNDIMFLVYSNCKEAQFITSKTHDIRIRLRKDEDPLDYNEILIPEQFVFQINEKKKVDCRVSDLYNY